MIQNWKPLPALLAVGCLVCVLAGCGPRMKVAQNKVIAQLDKMLGELDVKRQKIEDKKNDLNKQLNDVTARRVEAKVRLDALNKKKDTADKKMAEVTGKLKKVQELINEAKESGGTIERNGKEYTAEEIDASAQRVIGEFESAKARIEGYNTSIKALQGAHDLLAEQEKTAKSLMTQLETQIETIDSKKLAISDMRTATDISGNSQSITDSLAELQKEVEDLDIDIETKLQIEQEKLNELASTNSDADELLAEEPSLDSLGSKIDELLGNQ